MFPNSLLPISDKTAVMPYGLKLFLYAATWCILGSVIGYRWLSDFNFHTVFGIGLLMAVVMVLVGRWLFARKAL